MTLSTCWRASCVRPCSYARVLPIVHDPAPCILPPLDIVARLSLRCARTDHFTITQQRCAGHRRRSRLVPTDGSGREVVVAGRPGVVQCSARCRTSGAARSMPALRDRGARANPIGDDHRHGHATRPAPSCPAPASWSPIKRPTPRPTLVTNDARPLHGALPPRRHLHRDGHPHRLHALQTDRHRRSRPRRRFASRAELKISDLRRDRRSGRRRAAAADRQAHRSKARTTAKMIEALPNITQNPLAYAMLQAGVGRPHRDERHHQR